MMETLPRQYGVVFVCDDCGLRKQTAMIGRRRNRIYWRSQGWGRGSDPGSVGREARPAQEAVRDADGKLVRRARRALAERIGRPRTTGHDLCPPCLAKDRTATAERKRQLRERRAASRAALTAAANDPAPAQEQVANDGR
jgi:hypothetical protein